MHWYRKQVDKIILFNKTQEVPLKNLFSPTHNQQYKQKGAEPSKIEQKYNSFEQPFIY